MSLLDQKRVLRLNAQWKALDTMAVCDAFIALSKKTHKALHIEYPTLDNGNIDFSSPVTLIPVEWKDWINLPIREHDKSVNTSSSQIRVPTILVAVNYDKIPNKNPRYSKHAIWLRDKSTCQITGEKLTKSTGNIDHWVAQADGGETNFNNCLLLKKSLNSKKGDLSMEEFCKKYGYKVPKKPTKPETGIRPIVNSYGIPDWDIFVE